MATLAGVKPENSSYLEPGIYRVISGQPKTGNSKVKGTPFVEQIMRCVETGASVRVTHYITPKTIGRFAGWCQSLGLDDQQRATIDTDRVETMQGMTNRYCWIKVNLDNGGYSEVKDHAPDGDKPNWSEPVAPAQAAPANGTGSQSTEPMPWDNNGAPEPTPPEDDVPF
jgi:hypothetical protein